MASKQKLGKPNMIRFDDPTHADLKAVARANNISVSAVVRIAVNRQLPALKSGRTTLRSAAS